MATLRALGPRAYGDEPVLLGWWHPPSGQVAAACMQTPPFPLLLTGGPADAIGELADALAAAGRALPGVNASADIAGQFAARWRRHTGAGAVVAQRTRLYQLGELVPSCPAPAGHARVAQAADTELLVAWLEAFGNESGGVVHADSRKMVGERLRYGGMMLWESGGKPVSLAGRTREVAGMARVGPVYTPPGLRRRGYAGAVTAAVSQAALDAGAGEVLLFTDLANPTSNALYQRLGYHPVEDRIILSFTPRSPATPGS